MEIFWNSRYRVIIALFIMVKYSNQCYG
jgi:hypothetical protein